MITLTSIENIRDIYNTGSRPVIVHCDDLNDYLCKYDAPVKLLNEYLAAQFLHQRNLKTPEFAYVKIKKVHLGSFRLNPVLFDKLSFGTRFYDHAVDLTRIFEMSANVDISRIQQKESFLKIGLFDLWLSNEDRCFNNTNILLVPFEHGDFFVPIDHSAMFNTCLLYTTNYSNLVSLTQEDSIICTPYTPLLFKKGKRLSKTLESLENDFLVAVQNCEKEFNKIFDQVPGDWAISELIKEKIYANIFETDWINGAWLTFLQYLNLTLR